MSPTTGTTTPSTIEVLAVLTEKFGEDAAAQWWKENNQAVAAITLTRAVEHFQDDLGPDEFAKVSTMNDGRWTNAFGVWEHQGPYMSWLTNLGEKFAAGEETPFEATPTLAPNAFDRPLPDSVRAAMREAIDRRLECPSLHWRKISPEERELAVEAVWSHLGRWQASHPAVDLTAPLATLSENLTGLLNAAVHQALYDPHGSLDPRRASGESIAIAFSAGHAAMKFPKEEAGPAETPVPALSMGRAGHVYVGVAGASDDPECTVKEKDGSPCELMRSDHDWAE